MIRKILYLVFILGLVLTLSAVAGVPAQAQEGSVEPAPPETLETILARAAARSFLITLTRPELSNTQAFYLNEGVRVDGILAELGQVTGYSVDQVEWLTPGQTYQTTATLQPGNRQIIIYTGKHNNRWKVEGLELAGATAAGPATSLAKPVAGPQPVAGNGSGKLVFQTQSGGDIYIINADGTGLRRVTHGLDPELSPDGTQIVFTRWEPRYELFTVNVDGSNERGWFSDKRQMKSPSWSADGTKLVFSYQDGGRLEGELKTIDLREEAEKAAREENTTRIPDNARGVEINENGQLQFYIPPDAYWWLAQIDLVKEEYRELGTGARYNYAPTWHPTDPNQLILRADKGIMLFDAQAQVSRPVSYDDRDRGALAISPDGTKVALTYYQDGNWEIHTMNIDGSNRQRLTETPLYVVAERQTSNNELFITPEGFRTMTRAQPDGMPMMRWNNAAPAWSPDGSKIAFMTDRTGKWELWIMNADGTEQRPMFPNGVLAGLSFNFAGVDERMISWR
jgi:dipeptidyl aminopeptidase/acylaminoacyl peptidase